MLKWVLFSSFLTGWGIGLEQIWNPVPEIHGTNWQTHITALYRKIVRGLFVGQEHLDLGSLLCQQIKVYHYMIARVPPSAHCGVILLLSVIFNIVFNIWVHNSVLYTGWQFNMYTYGFTMLIIQLPRNEAYLQR